MKKYFLIFLFLLFGTCFPLSVNADSNFSTSAHVTYSILPSGMTHVVFNINLQNTTREYYASSYSLTVGFEDLQDIHASDPDGALTSEVKKEENTNTIRLHFNKKVVGLGEKLPFTIAFDTSDIAQKDGSIWEVNIPGITNQADFADFTVQVSVPASFGDAIYIKPPQPNTSLIFTKEQLGKAGISLAFGSQQIYQFDITYHLKNANIFPIRTEIALPLTTNYQETTLSSLVPHPTNVTRDEDGNWLAEYSLLPSQKMNIVAKGTITVFLLPKEELLTPAELHKYLSPKQYWEVAHPEIVKLARELQTPEAIYTYLVTHLTYDYARVTSNQTRLGALAVLTNPSSAVCLEFTDLFVTLARAAGIPAREMDGYAYTQNTKQRPLSLLKDVLHAWPEYYDTTSHRWIMVDPTWGNTTGGVDYFHTLDFDHVAFAIRGISSTYPVPAGGYKTAIDTNTKDIDVSFATTTTQVPETFAISSFLPDSLFGGLPLSNNLIIKNTGQRLLSPQAISIIASTLTPYSQTRTTKTIPPFGFETVPFSFDKTPLLTNTTTTITMHVNKHVLTKQIHIYPFFFEKYIMIGGGVFVIFCGILSVFAARTWYLSLSRSRE